MNILEKNGFTFKDSLEVEVFLVDEIDSNIIKPLKFVKRKQSVIDNKLIDEVETEQPEIDESYVEYYFDLRVDKEIPEDDTEVVLPSAMINSTFVFESEHITVDGTTYTNTNT